MHHLYQDMEQCGIGAQVQSAKLRLALIYRIERTDALGLCS